MEMDYLTNYKNYYIYADMVKNKTSMTVYVPEITEFNAEDHIYGIYAILQDGIETEYVHNLKITISWGNDVECKLSIIDYWFSLIMWNMILKTGNPVMPKHIFWSGELKKKNIKNYVDNFVLTRENKIRLGNYTLNNILCDGLWYFSKIEQFSYYLANTINNEDDIALMNAVPEFYDLLHCSLQGVPIDDVKNVGMEYTNRAIDIIKQSEGIIGYEHGLANSFRASEAINPRQYKEASLNIGTKPNGSGGIYPYIIDKSFKTGGVNDPVSYFIESSTARVAQILSKTNVGDSGSFARILGLNNTDTVLNRNMNYECMSNHFVRFEIKTRTHLSMIKNRYYRFNPRGMEYLIDDKDLSLIGKTVYLRSPMTCASNSNHKGICKRCYGDLYYTNIDINIGKIAAEILSSQLTQKLLSAKHLLETNIVSIQWNPEFKDWFDIDINCIKLVDFDEEVINLKKYFMVIDPEDVNLVNEEEDTIDTGGDSIDEDGVYNEYITHFDIVAPDGSSIRFESSTQDSMYITQELNNIIRRKANNANGMINIPLSSLRDTLLFYVKISNDEISKTMKDIENVLNKASAISGKDINQVLQDLVDLVVDGGVTIDSVHLEVILSNQIVSAEDILKKPNWNNPAAQYRVLSLNQALINNPSIIVSLLYQNLNKTLYNPLSFAKHAPSFFDLFFVEQPQIYMSNELLTEEADVIEFDKKILMAQTVDKTKEKSN